MKCQLKLLNKVFFTFECASSSVSLTPWHYRGHSLSTPSIFRNIWCNYSTDEAFINEANCWFYIVKHRKVYVDKEDSQKTQRIYFWLECGHPDDISGKGINILKSGTTVTGLMSYSVYSLQLCLYHLSHRTAVFKNA